MGERQGDESGFWFRDRLHDVIGLGAAGFIVCGGWLLSSDSVIGLDHPMDADHREAAMLLLVFIPVMWAGWYAYVVRLRNKCPDHPTVPARAWVHAFAWAVAVGFAVILHVAALD